MKPIQHLQAAAFGGTGRSLAVAALLAACGCSSMNNTESGAVTGGALGAGIGALAGAACHAPLVGAAIGAGAGALTGAAVGNSADRSEQRANDATVAAIHAQQQAQQQGVADVARMAQQHISDEVIIQQVRTGGVIYQLSGPEIEYLKGNGVSDAVIMEMQATASRRAVYVSRPVYLAPAGPPPIAVGVGYYR